MGALFHDAPFLEDDDLLSRRRFVRLALFA